MKWIDWFLLMGGLAGFAGTIRGWPMFFDEERLAPWITRFGARRVRISTALIYLALAVVGALFVLLAE